MLGLLPRKLRKTISELIKNTTDVGSLGWEERQFLYDYTLYAARKEILHHSTSSNNRLGISSGTESTDDDNASTKGDVMIIVEEEEFLLHRHLLYVRTGYFRALFDSGMKESIPFASKQSSNDTNDEPLGLTLDMPRAVFARLVCYIYTDRLPCQLSEDTALQLLQQSERLSIPRLSQICQKFLLSKLCIHNAAKLFEAADCFYVQPLKDLTLNYIPDKFDSVTRTPAFIDMEPRLIKEILCTRAGDSDMHDAQLSGNSSLGQISGSNNSVTLGIRRRAPDTETEEVESTRKRRRSSRTCS